MSQPITVEPGTPIRLKDFDARYTGDVQDKATAVAEMRENTAMMAELAHRLYAENRRAVLLVLQGMDTSGKDGTIRHVMRGVNPQSCQVVPFRQPSEEELDHDFLWRIHHRVPRKGNIGIFNRSHYEDVLIVRVRKLVPEKVWRPRFDMINDFERLLTGEGTTIIKVFLHISKDQQRKRLLSRLKKPDKNWKFDKSDLAERKRWDEYQSAYEEALTRCNTACAPWHIVPADRKWHRNLVVSRLLRSTLEQMNPQFPDPPEGLDGIVVE